MKVRQLTERRKSSIARSTAITASTVVVEAYSIEAITISSKAFATTEADRAEMS